MHFDVPKTMQQISGQLYKRLDQTIDISLTTEPIGVRVGRSRAADTVADEAICRTAGEASLTIVSVESKGTGWPEASSYGPREASQSRSRAASPDGGPSAESRQPSYPSFVDVPMQLNVSMQPAEAARDPAACHAAFIDLKVGDGASTSSTAMSTTAIAPGRLIAPGDAVDSSMASEAMQHHHGRVEWAGGTQGTAPAAAADEQRRRKSASTPPSPRPCISKSRSGVFAPRRHNRR